MKILLAAIILVSVSSLASAKDVPDKTQKLEFDDILVRGKFQMSDEAVTTVEQDKVLDALLGVRKDFKDRLIKSSDRN